MLQMQNYINSENKTNFSEKTYRQIIVIDYKSFI